MNSAAPATTEDTSTPSLRNRVVGFNYLPTGNTGEDFTLDAALTMQSLQGWSVTAYARNITNEAMPVIYQAGPGNIAAETYEPPRIYGLRVGYEF